MDKRYDFSEIERQMQDFWEREGVYRFDKDRDGELYSIDTPPVMTRQLSSDEIVRPERPSSSQTSSDVTTPRSAA